MSAALYYTQQGIQRGMERGMERGIQKGEVKRTYSIAINMLHRNFDMGTIRDVTGLSIDAIKGLSKV